MANVFGILTAIVLALAGFVAYKNKQAYEQEIAAKSTRADELQRSEARFKKAADSLESTKAELATTEEENVGLTSKESAQKKTNTDLQEQLASKKQKAASNKEKLDEIRAKTAGIGNLTELASKIRGINSELLELRDSIIATEAQLANVTAQNNATDASVKAAKDKLDYLTSSRSLPNLSTRIRSIYPSWGFVTLSAGDSSGVVANSTLDVVRDGSTIAKLLVTGVERNTASASIIPDSVAEDTTLMVGDRVVPGTKPSSKAESN